MSEPHDPAGKIASRIFTDSAADPILDEVVREERERCAKVCEQLSRNDTPEHGEAFLDAATEIRKGPA
jgi:hypothetical protein